MPDKTSKLPRGQTLVESYGLDNASSIPLNDKESTTGRKMGGGVDDLSHSLVGATEAEKYK